MKKNLCSKCNVCCVIYRIDKKFLSWRDTDKAKGEVCDKLINDRCVRYSSRPKLCKNFVCLWLKLSKEGMNNPEWRPDKIGFVVRVMNNPNRDLLCLEELERGSLDIENPTEEQDRFLKTIFTLRDNKNVFGNKEIHVVIKPFGHDKHHLLNYTPK